MTESTGVDGQRDSTEARAGAVTPGWYAVPSQGTRQFTITHTVADTGPGGDGATATATYILTLHDEWEDPIPDPNFVRHQAGGQPDVSGETVTDWSYIVAGIPAPSDPDNPNAVPPVPVYGPESSWSIEQEGKISVALEATLGAEFKLKDWVTAGGTAKTSAELTVTVAAASDAGKPSDMFKDAVPGTRYQPIVAYCKRQVHKLLKRYDNSGIWLNPDTAQLPIVSTRYGRWPKSKEEGVMEFGPSWMKVLPGQTPLQPGTKGFLSTHQS